MENLRRYQGDSYHQELPKKPIKSQNLKPSSGYWQSSVPLWEKKFCTSVGSIPWRKLVEAKKMMSFYENIVQWNDSAGEQAFLNAKSRFWAEINGLPCEITLPDPDIYIDEIDWNSNVDSELLLDLDREVVAPNEGSKDGRDGFQGDPLLFLNQPIKCTGWGNADEDPMRTANKDSKNKDNPWECGRDTDTGAVKGTKWENFGGDSGGRRRWEQGIDELENFEPRRTSGGRGTWEGNYVKREGNSRYMSRYKTSRFQGDDHRTDRGWNGRGRKRVNFVY